MRKIIYVAALAASLLGAGACRSKDERMDKAGKAVEKTTEKVEDRKDDLADKQKDLSKEREDLDKQQKEHQEKVREVEKQETDVTAAQGAELRAREDYAKLARERLDRADAKLRDLGAKSEKTFQVAATALRERRDTLAKKIDAMYSGAQEGWLEVKSDIDNGFDKLEKNLDEALKGTYKTEPMPQVPPATTPPAAMPR